MYTLRHTRTNTFVSATVNFRLMDPDQFCPFTVPFEGGGGSTFVSCAWRVNFARGKGGMVGH